MCCDFPSRHPGMLVAGRLYQHDEVQHNVLVSRLTSLLADRSHDFRRVLGSEMEIGYGVVVTKS